MSVDCGRSPNWRDAPGGDAVGPVAYFDLTAIGQHRARGIGRYVSALANAFRAIGVLGDLVTTDPNLRARASIVHIPVATSRVNDRCAPGQILVGTMYDLTPLRRPLEVFRPWQLGCLRRYLGQLSVIKHCDHVVAISECTARDTRRFLRVPGSAVSVISPGVDDSFRVGRSGPPPSTSPQRILAVGAASRHKNLPRLLEAHARLSHLDAELVLVGLFTDRQRSRLRGLASRLGTSDRVFFRGSVDEARLVDLYATSDVLVMPSLWEGFGLPVAEAMAVGIPVVCSDRSALPEVVGRCGELIDPTSVSDIARGIDLVLGDAALAQRMAVCGAARAVQFDWEESAQRHVDLYRALVRQP